MEFILGSHIAEEPALSSAEIYEISDGVRMVLLGERGFQTPSFRDYRWSEIARQFNAAYKRIRPDDDLIRYSTLTAREDLDKIYKRSKSEPELDSISPTV